MTVRAPKSVRLGVAQLKYLANAETNPHRAAAFARTAAKFLAEVGATLPVHVRAKGDSYPLTLAVCALLGAAQGQPIEKAAALAKAMAAFAVAEFGVEIAPDVILQLAEAAADLAAERGQAVLAG
jgi:hypothetical protein